MTSVKNENETRVLANDQDEYQSLSIEDQPFGDGNIMKSCWTLSDVERQAILNGGHMMLCILGTVHPPVILHVVNTDGELVE